jgi:tetratricopeptide (TPR) repeat protein
MKRLLTFLLLLSPFIAAAFGSTTRADSAHVFYDKKQYKKAAALYEKIVAENPGDAAALYNLGNTYYQLKKNGRCILCYEKALKIAPGDKDIRYNLELAQARISGEEKNNDVSETLGNAWYDFLQEQGEAFWGYATLAAVIMTALLLVLFVISRKTLIRRTALGAAVLFLCAGIFTFTGGWQLRDYNARESAIILVNNTGLYAIPGGKPAPISKLPEGTKVLTGAENGSWIQVTISRQLSGWVQKSALETI